MDQNKFLLQIWRQKRRKKIQPQHKPCVHGTQIHCLGLWKTNKPEGGNMVKLVFCASKYLTTVEIFLKKNQVGNSINNTGTHDRAEKGWYNSAKECFSLTGQYQVNRFRSNTKWIEHIPGKMYADRHVYNLWLTIPK